jgi:hypothetical protein
MNASKTLRHVLQRGRADRNPPRGDNPLAFEAA